MEANCKNRTLQWISKQLKDNNISLSHKLQRKEGQWNKLTKSELIDSLLRGYPINPTYAVKDGNILSLIDGVQRISTIRDFLDDTFTLSKTLEPIVVKVNTENGISEQEMIIAGKKFSKLDESVKDMLLASELQIYELSDYTEKDIREMFRRQNSGKALNNTQLRTSIETDEMSEVIYSLTSHPLFDKVLSPAQRRKDLDKDIVRQALMLIETNKEHDYASFKNKSMNDFIVVYQENIDYDKIKTFKQALDSLDKSFEELKINSTSLPMVLYASYRCEKDKKSFTKLVNAINVFIENYDTNEEYKQFCVQGTGNPENVRGRLDYWRGVIRTL